MHHNLIIKDGDTTKVVKEVLVDGIQFVDETPRAGSTNPVTSDGVKTAIDGAVGDVAENLQQQIDGIAERAGSGYTPKGEATVATLNALSGQENGELYTMTDAGTLTDGSLAVVAGDTVAWDATNEVWYKAMDYAPRQYGTNEVHNLPTTITAFRTGDVIPVDGPDGTAKMAKDDLLQVTAENALGSIHSLSDTATEADLVAGNFLAIDVSGIGGATKKLPAEEIAKRIQTFQQVLIGHYGDSLVPDLNDAPINSAILVRRTNATTCLNFPSDFPTDGTPAILSTYKSTIYLNNYYIFQVLVNLYDNKKWWRIYTQGTNSWTTWATSFDGLRPQEKEIFANWADNLGDLNNAPVNSVICIQRTAVTTTQNFPSDFPTDGKVATLTSLKAKYDASNYFIVQILERYLDGSFWVRRFNSSNSSWTSWEKSVSKLSVSNNQIFANWASNIGDLNNIEQNSVTIIHRTAVTTTQNFPSDFPTDGEFATLTATKTFYDSGKYFVTQVLERAIDGRVWYRTYNSATSSWGTWKENVGDSGQYNIVIGTGETYTTLKAGIAEAIKHKNSKVYVKDGTYDLKVEFAAEIHDCFDDKNVGIVLGNGVHVRFADGVKVVADFTNGDSEYSQAELDKITEFFQPFYGNVSDYTLENLNIETVNTRYCVHDECNGHYTYTRKYINCKMKYTNTKTNGLILVHAIGGGLGEHGTIYIDGGYYQSVTAAPAPGINDSASNSQIPILYHNGNNANADSSIEIKNVYLADRGFFKFGWYGPSEIKSRVLISACSTGLPTLHISQRRDGVVTPDNFDIVEWKNEQRVQGVHWIETSYGFAQLAND